MLFQQYRERLSLQKIKKVVVKVGSKILQSDEALANVCEFIAALKKTYKVILVSSGAITSGERVLKLDKNDLINRQALSAIGQPYLMNQYKELFEKYDIVTAQFLLTAGDFNSISRTKNAKQAIDLLLEKDILPIINENDVTATHELLFGDNDQLSGDVTCYFQAQMLLILSDIDSYDDKKVVHHVSMEEIVEKKSVQDEISWVGGYTTKLQTAKFILENGSNMFLANGFDLGDAYSFMLENNHKGGTLFCQE